MKQRVNKNVQTIVEMCAVAYIWFGLISDQASICTDQYQKCLENVKIIVNFKKPCRLLAGT